MTDTQSLGWTPNRMGQVHAGKDIPTDTLYLEGDSSRTPRCGQHDNAVMGSDATQGTSTPPHAQLRAATRSKHGAADTISGQRDTARDRLQLEQSRRLQLDQR